MYKEVFALIKYTHSKIIELGIIITVHSAVLSY